VFQKNFENKQKNCPNIFKGLIKMFRTEVFKKNGNRKRSSFSRLNFAHSLRIIYPVDKKIRRRQL